MRLKLVGFKEYADRVNPRKFDKRSRKHIGQATAKNGLAAEGHVKRGIYAGKYGRVKAIANAELTKRNKGSSRPLVDTGQLAGSINSRKTSWNKAYFGVLKSKAKVDSSGRATGDLLEIAAILHWGARIPVSNKMRNFFSWMANKYEAGLIKEEWHALKPSTKMIILKGRPFMLSAFTRKAKKEYKRNWDTAVQQALKGID